MLFRSPEEADKDNEAMNPITIKHIFTQLSLKQGLFKWKEKGEDAVAKELSQLHFCNTFEPANPSTLTKKEKERAIESHLFLKLKQDATMKGRMVAGGNKQCTYTPKEDAASPMAYLESVMLTAMINAKEGQDVAIANVPNAFVQT